MFRTVTVLRVIDFRRSPSDRAGLLLEFPSIRRRIEETKISLGRNLSRFERGAGAMVTIADHSVRESVSGAKAAVDPRVHIRRNPLLALGVSVITGLVIGRTLGRGAAAGHRIVSRMGSAQPGHGAPGAQGHRLRDGAMAIANVVALEALSKIFPASPATVSEVYQRWSGKSAHGSDRDKASLQPPATSGSREVRLNDLDMH